MEGNGKLGWISGTRYAVRCIILGPPWAIWEGFNSSLRFLYVVSGTSETFMEAWTTHEKWCDNPIESPEETAKRLEATRGL